MCLGRVRAEKYFSNVGNACMARQYDGGAGCDVRKEPVKTR